VSPANAQARFRHLVGRQAGTQALDFFAVRAGITPPATLGGTHLNPVNPSMLLCAASLPACGGPPQRDSLDKNLCRYFGAPLQVIAAQGCR